MVVPTIFLKSRFFLKSGFLKSRFHCTTRKVGILILVVYLLTKSQHIYNILNVVQSRGTSILGWRYILFNLTRLLYYTILSFKNWYIPIKKFEMPKIIDMTGVKSFLKLSAFSSAKIWGLPSGFRSSVNPITTRGQIMPTTSLLAHPDLKTKWHLCILHILKSIFVESSCFLKSRFVYTTYFE